MPVPANPIKRYVLILGSAWTLLVITSFAWTYTQQKNTILEIARSEARIAFQKDSLYRKWGAKHGGVYVPVTPQTQPNPYLPKSLERDITTPSGKMLTLVNPAYMTRQVFELAAEGEDIVRGHITSLTPIRPENAPDAWERTALSEFEKGVKEVSEATVIDGQSYLRLMRPFVTEQPCMKCHADQGYKVGEIRGGISVSIPLKFLSANSKEIIAGSGAAHSLIWLTGICIIGFGARTLTKNDAAIREKNMQLEKEIAVRQQAQEQLQEQASLLEEEIGERQMAQEALQEQAVILEEEIADRTQAQADIILSEEKFSKTFQNAPLMMAITRIEDGTLLDINNKFIELSGYSRDELIGRTSVEIGWVNAIVRNNIVEECRRNGRVTGMDLTLRTKEGKELTTSYFGELFPIDGETRLLSVYLDVTEQRKTETQLLHAQKMEAIGTLAGGVAHDFNNVLTVIAGYASLLSMQLKMESKESAMVGEILSSVDRATEMTRSILAFSRKEPMNTKPEDINRIISSLEKSLRRLIREDVEFTCTLSDHPAPVMVDKGQFEQVLINLVVNARDAMPSGGTLAVSSTIISVNDEEIGLDDGIMPGAYSLISVSDSGIGMDSDTRDRIFEPFFTTKDINKGTGLGLYIVYGIIAKHNGKITVYSEIGHGTIFRIYLPLLNQLHQEAQTEPLKKTIPGGHETILLVDDDFAVRTVTTLILENSGYVVHAAENGETALLMFRNNRETIQLLITDVIMPRMSGKELFEEIHKLNATIPVVFMSGYTSEIMEEMMLPHGNVTFLSKPIKSEQILIAARQMLDADQSRV